MLRAAALALLACLPPGAEAACRQALAIGLDVSGSVDHREFVLQVQGLAQALQSEKVRTILLDVPGHPVALAVFDWSGADYQRVMVAWTDITDTAVLDRITSVIASAARIERSPATGVGTALLYGDRLLAERPDCWRRTLDLTGDGLNNSGPQPRDIRLPPRGAPVTVNALVIGIDGDAGWDGGDPGIAELTAWFASEVIRGPDAFVETALGFEDFAAAMERKLVKELSALQLGSGRADLLRDDGG